MLNSIPTNHKSKCTSNCRLAGLFAALLLTFPGVTVQADSLQAAIDSPDRPAADHDRDVTSKPGQVLRFFKVPSAGVVVDLFAGGGYYSELLSRNMGDNGTVYMHNNAAYLGFTGDAVEQRLVGERLPNVVRYDRELDAIDLPTDSVDLVLMVMTYHDLYFKTVDWDIDADEFFETLHRILKPGGILAVVDHQGEAGSGNEPAQDLHRIDPAFARNDIEARGFRLEASSDLLNNPDDNLDISVFDPSVQGKTSKFIYRFSEAGN
jgi:predicted methyltransferase